MQNDPLNILSLEYRMVSSNVKRKIVRLSMTATCLKRKVAAAKSVKVTHQNASRNFTRTRSFMYFFRVNLQSVFTMVNDTRAEPNGQTQMIHAPVTNALPESLPNRISNATHHVIIHCYRERTNAVQHAWVSYFLPIPISYYCPDA